MNAFFVVFHFIPCCHAPTLELLSRTLAEISLVSDPTLAKMARSGLALLWNSMVAYKDRESAGEKVEVEDGACDAAGYEATIRKGVEVSVCDGEG